jgi:hypothetical protein
MLKVVPGHSDYAADTEGNVYTRRPKGGNKLIPYGQAVGPFRPMKPEKMPGNYLRVRIGADGAPARVGVMVHRVIAHTFLGMRPEGYVIAHLNGDPTDNRLCNLAYVTPAENKAHELVHGTRYQGDRHHARKVKSSDWLVIVQKIVNGATQAQISREYGISRQAIARRLKEHSMQISQGSASPTGVTTGTITHA